MKIKTFFLFCLMVWGTLTIAQDAAPDNWFNLDFGTDKVTGVSTEKTYEHLLKGRSSQTVVVAVIDSGVDNMHEDLKDIMWVNADEIPGNGIDDDKNGYVDDINGWNFIGGKDGKNIEADALEMTRLVGYYGKKFENVDPSSLKKKAKKKYKEYLEMKKLLDEKRSELADQSANWFALGEMLNRLNKAIGKDDFTVEELEAFETEDEVLVEDKAAMTRILGRGNSIEDIREQVIGAVDHFDTQLNKWYNPDFDPRASIVGDNYANSSERGYGNNDVKGPDSFHGTHVAGIIAAVRDNDLGVKGVADNVRIMSIRAVPDGDERDKDVANAIYYAVDNGAAVINMSFGKSYVSDKKAVDKAVKYAQKHDVLLVHASGNDASNIDSAKNFPTDKYQKSGWFKPKRAKNWIEVGALSYKGGENAVASFSNYGKENVDVFAPGHHINSTTPEQGYAKISGTSMASPVVAGVAATLRSYYPTLTASQVKSIIMDSVSPQTQKVKQPGTKALVSFSELCQTAGVVNVYKAVKIAEKTKGKKKVKKQQVTTTTKPVVRP